MEEIIVRKPKPPKFWGAALSANRYANRQYKWMSLLPNNGDRIKITWLPNPRNAPKEVNCYIGMEGVVRNMTKTDGTFEIHTGTAILMNLDGNFNYIKL